MPKKNAAQCAAFFLAVCGCRAAHHRRSGVITRVHCATLTSLAPPDLMNLPSLRRRVHHASVVLACALLQREAASIKDALGRELSSLLRIPDIEVDLASKNIGLVSASELSAMANLWRTYRCRGH